MSSFGIKLANPNGPVFLQIGDAVAGGSPNSVLIVDSSGNLGEVTPSADGFLFWDNTAMAYSFVPSTSILEIGDPIGGSTPTEVLYTGLAGELESDSGFTRDPGNNFLTTIQQSNGTGIVGTLTGSGGSWGLNTTDTGPSGNIGRLDNNSTFVRILSIYGTGETGVISASGNENRSQWTDPTTSIISTSVQDINQSTLTHIDGVIDARLEATSTRVRLQYDNGANLVSNAIFDANSYTIKWDNNAGTTATHYGNSFGSNSVWSDGTAQSSMNATNTKAYAEFGDGLGNIANTLWDATATNTTFASANGYTAQDYGTSNQAYKYFVTPYQLPYNNIAGGPFTPGETVTGGGSGATAGVVSDEGTYLIVNNVVGSFQTGETITGDAMGTTADLTTIDTQIGFYEGIIGIGQDVTPTALRHIMILNDTSNGNDRIQLADPNAIYQTVNNTIGTTSSQILDTTQFDIRFRNGLNQDARVHGEPGNAYLKVEDPSAMSISNVQLLSDSATLRWRLTTPNSKSGIVSVDHNNDSTYMNFSDGLGGTGTCIVTENDATLRWTDSSTITGEVVADATLTTIRHTSLAGVEIGGFGVHSFSIDQSYAQRGQRVNRTAVSDTDYVILTTDYAISYTTLSTTRTVTVPAANAVGAGTVFIVKDATGNANSNNIILSPSGGSTIDGAATKTINTSFGLYRIMSDGASNWEII